MDSLQEVNTLSIIENMNISKVESSLGKISQFQQIVQKTLIPSVDFGASFPNASKPSLLKPGAEKILMLLGLASQYEVIDKIQDYEEGFFAYTVKCLLTKNGQVITEGVGHCNSKEKKYTSEKQDTFMLGNTCLKMAKKRAQVDATLTVASLSNIFTQDLEDMAQFQQQEQAENMAIDDALNIKINFGKHKGKTLGEIDNESPDYVEWLAKKSKDQIVRQAAEMVMNHTLENASAKQQTPVDKTTAANTCADCGKPSSIADYTRKKYGRVLCQECMMKQQTNEPEQEDIFKGSPFEGDNQ